MNFWRRKHSHFDPALDDLIRELLDIAAAQEVLEFGRASGLTPGQFLDKIEAYLELTER